MVLESGTPFRRTLHPPTGEQSMLPSLPMSITADIPTEDPFHNMIVHIPPSKHLSGIELTSVELVSAQNQTVPSHVYSLFAQLLDAKGRPSSNPFPLAVFPSTNCAIDVNCPFHNDQRTRFFICRNSDTATSGLSIRFTGKIFFPGGASGSSANAKKAVKKFLAGPWHFSQDSMTAPSKKRPRAEDVTESKASRDKSSPKRSKREESIPTLTYAPFPGGDDES